MYYDVKNSVNLEDTIMVPTSSNTPNKTVRLVNYSGIVERNSQAYALIFEIEVITRELVHILLERKYGNRWLKEGVPPDVKEKISAGLAYQKRVKWNTLTPYRPFYYVDFPDLKKIILNGANWVGLFDAVFGSKPLTDSSLSEIESIRNTVAHNRFSTDNDLEILRASRTKLIGIIPSELRSEIETIVTKTIPVGTSIQMLRDALNAVAHAVADGSQIPPSLSDALSVVDLWWFDQAYLGSEMPAVRMAVDLCTQYAEIPSGVGQALSRRKWATANELVPTIYKATNEINSL